MKLPVFITVPHGGTQIPSEANECRLSVDQIACDNDTWSRDLYQFSEDVVAFRDTLVPRAIVDLNRAPDDFGPGILDGVVKTVTVDGTQIWSKPNGASKELVPILIERYHTTWHRTVTQLSATPGLVLGLDCHTMLALGPPGHALAGKPRPLICLSNRGDSRGQAAQEDLTAPTGLFECLFDSLVHSFQHEEVEIEPSEPRFRMNDPFRGGYICRHQARASHLPWIQLELSRALYLPSDFGPTPSTKNRNRLQDLRNKIHKALQRIV